MSHSISILFSLVIRHKILWTDSEAERNKRYKNETRFFFEHLSFRGRFKAIPRDGSVKIKLQYDGRNVLWGIKIRLHSISFLFRSVKPIHATSLLWKLQAFRFLAFSCFLLLPKLFSVSALCRSRKYEKAPQRQEGADMYGRPSLLSCLFILRGWLGLTVKRFT